MDNHKAYYREIGKRIKKARETASLSQAELGKAIGVSDTAVSLYENGDRFISVKMLNAIAETLDLEIEELIQGYPSKPDVSYALRADERLRNNPEAQRQILDFIEWVKDRSNAKRKNKTR